MVTFSPRALAALERIEKWWREQRPEAATLFREELAAALARIELLPSAGQLYRRGKREIRRVLLPRTGNHVYYRAERDGLYIHTISNAISARPPRL